MARVIVVGAGPAGVRAAEGLVAAGLRPTVIDEADRSGGQIYRRQPAGFTRSYSQLYGFDAAKAHDLHRSFDRIVDRIDYRPETLAWSLSGNRLFTVADGVIDQSEFDAIILATGATDRLLPIQGWTLPGCYSLGGAQVALKAQACAIGQRVAFIGTGPLLYLVAFQYMKAGVDVCGVFDTSTFAGQIRSSPALARRPGLLARGFYFQAKLRAGRVPLHTGVEPLVIRGENNVTGVALKLANGQLLEVSVDAVGLGFHLRSESQLADLAGCTFEFELRSGQWRIAADEDGRSSRSDVYVAGDGATVLGADAAEVAGRLAATALLGDLGLRTGDDREDEVRMLRRRMKVFRRFADGLATAFPWPAALARAADDGVVVCRCEAITAGAVRTACQPSSEINRTKAFSRVGMGRCQGRFCGAAAAEIIAGAQGVSLETVGRIRAQAPVKPLSIGARARS